MKQKDILIIALAGVLTVILATLGLLLFYFHLNKSDDNQLAAVNNQLNSGMIYTVQDDATNLYTSPDMSSTVLMQCNKDTTVQFLSFAENGFYKVSLNGTTGYMQADKLIDTSLPPPAEPDPTPEPEQAVYVVNVEDAVYLRKNPDMNSENITTIALGTQITLIKKENDDFSKVRYNGTEGYVLNKYLTTDVNIATNQIQQKAAKKQEKQLPPGSSSVTVKSTMYVVNVQNSIYLRTNPSEDAPVITTIPLGSAVGYIDTVENGFYKISWNGNMGYSKSQYLSSYYSGGSYNSGGSTMTVYGVKHSIYLRSSPSENTSYITEIPVGAVVTYLGNAGNGYYKIRYNGMVGYATAAYLR